MDSDDEDAGAEIDASDDASNVGDAGADIEDSSKDGPSEKPPKKKRKTKAKVDKKGSVAAHGRGVLDNTSFKEKKEPEKRDMRTLPRLTKSLQKQHGTRSLNCGTLMASLRGNPNFNQEAQDIVGTIINSLVSIVNVVHIHAQKAALFLIENVMAGPVEHHFLLQEMVTSGTANDGGNLFWQNLSNLVCTGATRTNSLLLNHFMGMEGWNNFVIPTNYTTGFPSLSRLLENNASNLAASFRGQVVGRLSLLIAKVVLTNGEDSYEEIRKILKKFCDRPTSDSTRIYLENAQNGTFFVLLLLTFIRARSR